MIKCDEGLLRLLDKMADTDAKLLNKINKIEKDYKNEIEKLQIEISSLKAIMRYGHENR